MATKTVRVLVDQTIEGKEYKSGALVQADTEVLKPYIKEKTVDASKAGVEYAREQGQKVQVIESTEQEQQEPEDPVPTADDLPEQ